MMESAAPPMPQYFHAAEAMDMLTRKPSPTTSAAGASRYFVQRATAAGGNPGLIRTDREHLSELERKLMEARQRFQDLKEEKCHANLKGCGCSCCPHGYVRARDEKATSVGPDSRSFSETSNLPAKKSATSRQHLTRSNLAAASCYTGQRRSLRINGIRNPERPSFRNAFDV
ncbi:uncharacterized protein [Physcomitrium patens]|uniref:uncharacterized protein isoform X2 n=1 Tax=Physcomitrium patens TaxID=3218 RepID=UPI000D17CEFF|nr:uncharacterized protein LOC112294436 isoform X2 [Physcomitrium patens]|eukprot:XP_024400606.1 uncharacterized protein LOC112294436 isoform X2 [Physcomitrella patens]